MNQVGEVNPRELMIRQQIMERGIQDERVIEAMRAIPRENFFPAEARPTAYADRAAPIGHGQTISQPYMVALMTSRLNVQPTYKLLEIGTGSGYQTAILAKLAREVYTVERVKPLLDAAFERLLALDIRNVHFHFGDGTLGWAQFAPFERILITAGAPVVPETLLRDQLADGGIAILPVGPDDEQMLVEVRRNGNDLRRTDICACRFVKLIGQEGWVDGTD
jgi:protein-L-isoaspartate(D-aspartate) O-methyltransferase